MSGGSKGGFALTALADLAREYGLPRTTLFDTLSGLRRKDIALDGKCDWWVQHAGRGKVWINESKLKKAHADMYPEKYPTRTEFQELSDRVDEIEDRMDLDEIRGRLAPKRDGLLRSPVVGGRSLRAVPKGIDSDDGHGAGA